MRHVIPVIAGKGGVGKSTVSVNLAVALAKTGAKVALIDGDIYGPSIPLMMGGGKIQADSEGLIIPAERYGVKYLSIGFMVDPEKAVMWRGPMVHKALLQLFTAVNWGEVDYCIVDMPPGTGDAQISLSQNIPLAGAVIVTTPQEVALADVRKAIQMLQAVNVPLLGLVENMGPFKAADGSVVSIFGTGGGEALSKQFGIPLLATLPLDPRVREGGDKGEPVAWGGDSLASEAFDKLAKEVARIVEERAPHREEVRIVN